MRAGWRVHTWAYPVIWFARRKPESTFRQWLWSVTDRIKWRRAMRYRAKLVRMSDSDLAEHLNRKYGNR